MKQEIESMNWYIKTRPTYKKLALKIENILIEIFDSEGISYHMINSRPKEIDSFKKKIAGDKYDDPTNQIQDLAGIRIITYVDDEIKPICDLIENIFDIDSSNSSDKSDELGIDKVGYKSIHYIASLKSDRLKLPEYKQFENLCFEIQIRTILQHAWAEIEHDRNYKFTGKLPHEISRRFKLLAGSLEIADREFNNISREIDEITQSVKEETEKGNLNIELNSTSLYQFLKSHFKILLEQGFTIEPNSDAELLTELNNYGLQTLEDLNNIIPKDFVKTILSYTSHNILLTEIGLVRMLMIINNYEKYFTKSFNNRFAVWSHEGDYKDLFIHYEINWEKDITEKFNVPFS